MKIINTLTILVSYFHFASGSFAQTIQKVGPLDKVPSEIAESDTTKLNLETEKKVIRNPFAAATGATNLSARLVRESLDSTNIVGIIHMNNGQKMAAIKINSNTIFVTEGSTFSVQVKAREWRDVKVIEITQFEVKVTPKGADSKIIIR